MPLHDELANLSGTNPAGYIMRTPFARLTLERLKAAIDGLSGVVVQTGNGQLSARLRDVAWSGVPNVQLVEPLAPVLPDKEVDILITSDFTIYVEIFPTPDPTRVVSLVTTAVREARCHARSESNLIVLDGADFEMDRSIDRQPDADQILADQGIDSLEAAHVEGHIGYGVISQAIAMSLGARHEISLAAVFPAVDFGTSIKLAILSGGEALGIIPSDAAQLNQAATCQCAGGPDLGVSQTQSEAAAHSPPNPAPGDEVGSVTMGGPIAENKDPLTDFGHRIHDERGLAGLYLPLGFAESMLVEVMPAIKIRARDNGVIGFNAEASVGFKNFHLSVDQQGGGLLLDIDLDIDVSAYCDFEVFKGVRLPIGWAMISPAQGSVAHLQLGFYPSVDSSGSVRLRSTLRQADMGQYVAVVIGVGTALKIIGVTAWIGFLIDVVLATILSVGLPIALRKAISDYLGKKEWKLLDGFPVANPLERFFPAALYDTRPASILAGVDSRG